MKTLRNSVRSGFCAIAAALLFFLITEGRAQEYTWTKLSDMTNPSAALAASAENGMIYGVGGTDKSMELSQYGEPWMQIFNPATNSWSQGAWMHYPRMMLGSAVVDGIIYAIGGGFDAYLTDVVEAYDPATDRWTNKASKPTQSSCFGTAVVEKKIYLVGGAQKTSAYPTEMYDPATDKWSTLKPITIPVAGLACAAANGKIYAIGGVDANYACRDLLQVYDVATNTWATKAHMPLARFGSVATVIANKIYVFGGAVFPMNVATKTLQVYEIETNTWTSEELLPEATQWAAIATNPDNSVYILAGENKCMMTYSDATIYKFLYKFKVNSTGIETLNANNDCSLSIIPNPATQQVTIKYRTVEDGIVTIEMYNITGNKIDVLTNRFEQQGLHEITQNMVNLPAGIYFCRLKSGTAMRMEKVVKIN